MKTRKVKHHYERKYQRNTRKRKTLTIAGIHIPPDIYIAPRIWTATNGLKDGPASIHYPVTKNRKAQYYIDHALSTLYSFNQNDACALFLKAAAHDPNCGFAFWGASYSMQMNINHLTVNKNIYRFCLNVLEKANKIKNIQSPKIRLLIEALESRTIPPNMRKTKKKDIILKDTQIIDPLIPGPTLYIPDYGSAIAIGKDVVNIPQQQLTQMLQKYSSKMKRIHEKFPYDVEISVLYAASIMMVHPWKWWKTDSIYKKWGLHIGKLTDKGINNVINLLLAVLHKNPTHLGACHYFIHAIEESPIPSLAAGVAERIATIAPFAGHIIHMPSHIYQRVGRYYDAVLANERAILVDHRYTTYMDRYFPKFASYYVIEYISHNCYFLIRSAQHLGNWHYIQKYSPVLKRHVLRFIKEHHYMQNFLAVPILAALRFGKWQNVIHLPLEKYKKYSLVHTLFTYAKIIAYASTKNLHLARKYFNNLKKMKIKYHDHSHRSGGIVAPDVGTITINNSIKLHKLRLLVAESIIHWYSGHQDKAIRQIKKAVKIYEILSYDEPPSFYYPPHITLARFLYETDKPHESIKTSNRALEIFPNSIRALKCKLLCYQALNNQDAITLISEQYSKISQHADVDIKLEFM